MPNTFTPPATTSVPPIGVEPHEGDRLMRFFKSRPEGVNVYLYKVGSTTATSLAAQSLPRVSETDPISLYDSAGAVTTNGWDDLEIVFWGGTGPYTVTAAQATVLTAAGYTIT